MGYRCGDVRMSCWSITICWWEESRWTFSKNSQSWTNLSTELITGFTWSNQTIFEERTCRTVNQSACWSSLEFKVILFYSSIGSGVDDVREVERHPFFANIPFRLYEEKRVCCFSFDQINFNENFFLLDSPVIQAWTWFRDRHTLFWYWIYEWTCLCHSTR